LRYFGFRFFTLESFALGTWLDNIGQAKVKRAMLVSSVLVAEITNMTTVQPNEDDDCEDDRNAEIDVVSGRKRDKCRYDDTYTTPKTTGRVMSVLSLTGFSQY